MTSSIPHPSPSRAEVTFVTWLLRAGSALLIVAVLYGLDVFCSARVNAFYYEEWILMAGIAAIMAASLNLVNGVTGQFSLGHAGFMAVGAYTSALFTEMAGQRLALPGPCIFALGIVVGAIAAALMGLFVGLPSLRLRGDYLAITTLGFNQIIISVVQNMSIIGGATGYNGEPSVVNHIRVAASGVHKYTNGAWVFALLILCIVSLRNLTTSQLGREMKAIRDDEVAAEAAGIATTRVKVLAFVFSAMWAGVAGALQSHLHPLVHPSDFQFVRSVEFVVMVVVGGLGSLTGSVCAAFLLTFLGQILRDVSGAIWVSFGVIILAAIFSLPRYRPLIKQSPFAIVRWLLWPVVCAIGVGLMLHFGGALLQKYIGALRYVIYAIILIVMMLLRPQGLLGRAEWSLRRRRPPAGASLT